MIKAPLEAELDAFLREGRREEDLTTAYTNAYGRHELFTRVREADHPGDLPDVISHLGFGGLLHKAFRERFVDGGTYGRFAVSPARRRLSEGGFLDPEGRYCVLAINPMVMVVDLTRLDGRPMPTKWADILEPEYCRSVGAVGRGPFVNEALALTIHKEFGLEGVRKLGRAIAWTGHPAQMVKVAGRALKDAPAISILDYFFARVIRRQDRICIVWPEEGALAIPFIALVKGEATGEARRALSFLAGPLAARIYADAYFIPAHGGAASRVPESAPLNWLGWQYLREKDPQSLMETINPALVDGFTEARQ